MDSDHTSLGGSGSKSNRQDLRVRTKEFALRIIRMYGALPSGKVAQVLGDQVLRSGTSVGAHFREAHRSRSTPEFVAKVEGGLQELEETLYWLELLVDSDTLSERSVAALIEEAGQLIAILTTCAKNAKARAKASGLSR